MFSLPRSLRYIWFYRHSAAFNFLSLFIFHLSCKRDLAEKKFTTFYVFLNSSGLVVNTRELMFSLTILSLRYSGGCHIIYKVRILYNIINRTNNGDRRQTNKFNWPKLFPNTIARNYDLKKRFPLFSLSFQLVFLVFFISILGFCQYFSRKTSTNIITSSIVEAKSNFLANG